MKKRKWWFALLKKLMRVRYKKVTFQYLGEEIGNGDIVLCNHEGTDGPMSWEMHSGKQVRFWGAHEMNSGLRKLYGYQTKVYFHEKKHWNLFLARLFCLIASPLTNLFYKGLDIISTYQDGRFRNTLKESVESMKAGDNIVLFPEKSDEGYQDVLKGFHGGFVSLAKVCEKEGIDAKIFVTYFNKKKKLCIVDKPVLYSELAKKYATKEEICDALCDRCNQLGEMTRK